MTHNELIDFLRSYSKPSKQQQMLIDLAAVEARTKEQERVYAVLLKAEMAIRKAAEAKAKVAFALRSDDQIKKDRAAARKARNHRLIKLGVLVDLAGLQDKSRGELLGAFLGLASVESSEKWQAWKQKGDAVLAAKSSADD